MYDLGRLCDAVQRSRLVLQRFRENRREMVRQFVGSHWSDEGTEKIVPVNLVGLYISVVGRNLIAKNPRVMLTVPERAHKPMVRAMQDWSNKEMERQHLDQTLQRCVLDSLFSIGICKVGLASPADAASLAWNLRAGQPFAVPVDLDDFVYDTTARSFEEVSYIGHRYSVPLEVVKDDPSYAKWRKDITASEGSQYNAEGDERIAYLGRGQHSGDLESFEDTIDLWEVYLPRHRLVLTLTDDQITGASPQGTRGIAEPLREAGWVGSDQGPYHVLGYGVVPGNAMPKGPIQDLIDMHETVNRLWRKLIRQAERQKEVLGCLDDSDAARFIESDDGDGIKMRDPKNVALLYSGKVSQENFALATALKDLFTYMAGNLDMMGGLSPQSKTLGQDRLLAENASRALADMQARTLDFTSSVVKGLCWYFWKDPFRIMKTKFQLPGMPQFETLRQVMPEQRQRVAFEDLDIRVDPYSMQHQTPQSKMQGMLQVIKEIYMPLAALAQQQGVTMDLNDLFKKVGNFMDQPDLVDLLTIQEPPATESVGEKPGMPAQTERSYVRENRSAPTRQGSDLNMAATLMGADPGGAQKNGQQQMVGA